MSWPIEKPWFLGDFSQFFLKPWVLFVFPPDFYMKTYYHKFNLFFSLLDRFLFSCKETFIILVLFDHLKIYLITKVIQWKFSSHRSLQLTFLVTQPFMESKCYSLSRNYCFIEFLNLASQNCIMYVNIRILILNLSPLHFFIETDFKIDKIKYFFNSICY